LWGGGFQRGPNPKNLGGERGESNNVFQDCKGPWGNLNPPKKKGPKPMGGHPGKSKKKSTVKPITSSGGPLARVGKIVAKRRASNVKDEN